MLPPLALSLHSHHSSVWIILNGWVGFWRHVILIFSLGACVICLTTKTLMPRHSRVVNGFAVRQRHMFSVKVFWILETQSQCSQASCHCAQSHKLVWGWAHQRPASPGYRSFALIRAPRVISRIWATFCWAAGETQPCKFARERKLNGNEMIIGAVVQVIESELTGIEAQRSVIFCWPWCFISIIVISVSVCHDENEVRNLWY